MPKDKQTSSFVQPSDKNEPSVRAVRSAMAPGGLRDAVMAALGYSTEVRGARTGIAAADADVEAARSGYYPTLQSEVGAGTSSSHDYRVTLAQPLYDWGRTSAQVSGAQAGRSAAFVELSAQREQVMLNAASAYIAVARTTELEQVAADELTAYQRIGGLASQRTEGGYGDATEAALAQLHVDQAQSSLEEARGKIQDARSIFASRVGHAPGSLAPIPELSTTLKTALRLSGSKTAGETSLVERAGQSPLVKAALARAEKADADATAQKAELFPTLSAEAYVRGDSDDDLKNGIGLRLTGPTLTGFSNFKRVEAARHLAEQERWNAETSKRDVLRQVQAFLDQEPILRARQASLKEQRKRAVQLRDLYEDQFKTSTRTLSDLVTVQSDLTQIETALINARFDLYDLQYQAAGALGLLGDLLAITPVSEEEAALPSGNVPGSASQKQHSRRNKGRACNVCMSKKSGL
ncbi:TolC family protein [Phyllobacterium phragmitis]|uniref:TolC family protein n=1 Tax=Phyllobacterium phragmitis TaxID=2670329 RepID=A0ABQ0H5M8_9HYPH